jgi:hypothetical protein
MNAETLKGYGLRLEITDEQLNKEKELADIQLSLRELRGEDVTVERAKLVANLAKDILSEQIKISQEKINQGLVAGIEKTELERTIVSLKIKLGYQEKITESQKEYVAEEKKLSAIKNMGIFDPTAMARSTKELENQLKILRETSGISEEIIAAFEKRSLHDILMGQYGKILASTDSFTEAFRAKIAIWADDAVMTAQKMAEKMVDAFDSVINVIGNTLGDVFDDLIDGKMKPLSEYLQKFAKDMTKVFSDLLMGMMKDKMKSLFGGLFEKPKVPDTGKEKELSISTQLVPVENTLTATYTAQIPVILQLAAAYQVLNAAKGGGGGMGLGAGNTGIGEYTGWADYMGGLVTAHAGGVIPSFHKGGLNYDERVIKAQTGEGVLSRRGMQALDRLNDGDSGKGGANVEFNITNNSSQPVQAEKKGQRIDHEKVIIDVVLKDLSNFGPMFHAVRGAR